MNEEMDLLMVMPLAKICEMLYDRADLNNEKTDFVQFEFKDCRFKLEFKKKEEDL